MKFKNNINLNEKAQLKHNINAQAKHKFSLVNGLELLTIPVGNVDKVLNALKHNPNVIYAEPDYFIEPNSIIPNDSDYSSLWGMDRINAPQAWSVATGDVNQIIAVVDSGVDFNHPDLVNNMWVNSNEIPNDGIDNDNNGYVDDVHGYDFVNNDGSPLDDESHGTHVAGSICAEGNNNLGVVGVVWQCKIMAVKFLGADKRGSYSDAIQAIEYSVAMGAKLANHSWGGSSYSQGLYDAINSARSSGQMLVISAGNDSADIDITPAYPASYGLDNIITVANIESDDGLRASSSWGEVVVDLGLRVVTSTRPFLVVMALNRVPLWLRHM